MQASTAKRLGVDNSDTKARARKSWEETALVLAETIAECRSQDPYVQVGACAVLNDYSIALGYNGPPPGIEIDWSDRESRGARVIHAEVNALRSVLPGQCKFLAVTLLPCRHCMTFIASKGVKKIVFRKIYQRDQMAFELAREFGIELLHVPCTAGVAGHLPRAQAARRYRKSS
jgi:deoxycytidylate deaminase